MGWILAEQAPSIDNRSSITSRTEKRQDNVPEAYTQGRAATRTNSQGKQRDEAHLKAGPHSFNDTKPAVAWLVAQEDGEQHWGKGSTATGGRIDPTTGPS
jgi:hypothetical protein